jgi:hypothetical protein
MYNNSGTQVQLFAAKKYTYSTQRSTIIHRKKKYNYSSREEYKIMENYMDK